MSSRTYRDKVLPLVEASASFTAEHEGNPLAILVERQRLTLAVARAAMDEKREELALKERTICDMAREQKQLRAALRAAEAKLASRGVA